MNWFAKQVEEFKLQMCLGRVARAWETANEQLIDATQTCLNARTKMAEDELDASVEAELHQPVLQVTKHNLVPLSKDCELAAKSLKTLDKGDYYRSERELTEVSVMETTEEYKIPIIQADYKGEGIGGFFGRLFSGRLGRRNQIPELNAEFEGIQCQAKVRTMNSKKFLDVADDLYKLKFAYERNKQEIEAFKESEKLAGEYRASVEEDRAARISKRHEETWQDYMKSPEELKKMGTEKLDKKINRLKENKAGDFYLNPEEERELKVVEKLERKKPKTYDELQEQIQPPKKEVPVRSKDYTKGTAELRKEGEKKVRGSGISF